jgi:hypothetical protein
VPTEPVDPSTATRFGVEAVEQAAVSGEDRAEVLQAEITFDHRLAQVTDGGHDGHDEAQQQTVTDATVGPRVQRGPDEAAERERRDHARDEPFDRLVG